MKTASRVVAALVSAIGLPTAYSDAVYFDSTFTLADYTVIEFLSPYVTASVSQSAAGGNPGSAMQVDFSFATPPAGVTTVSGTELFVNALWSYDPLTQGGVGSVSFSADRYLAGCCLQGTSGLRVTPVISQAGAQYGYFGSAFVPWQDGAGYVTSVASGLQLSDFIRIIDPANSMYDASSHPSDSAGILYFGFGTSQTLFANNIVNAGMVSVFTDNVAIQVASLPVVVPLPGALGLFCAGFGVLAVAARRR